MNGIYILKRLAVADESIFDERPTRRFRDRRTW